MERYFDKIASCMRGVRLQVDDETYAAVEGLRIVYAIVEGKKKAVVDGACAFQFDGEMLGGAFGVKVCDMNHRNRLSLNRYYRFTAPQAFGCKVNTMTCLKEKDIIKIKDKAFAWGKTIKPTICFPIENIREEERMTALMDQISWNVFQHGYKNGYSIAVNHIKTVDEAQKALKWGASMILLECENLSSCFVDRICCVYNELRKNSNVVDFMLDFSQIEEISTDQLWKLYETARREGIMVTGIVIPAHQNEGGSEYWEFAKGTGYKLGISGSERVLQANLINEGLMDGIYYHLIIRT